ncbi:MAG: NAD(P)-dependent alcohol dehydrogenase [Phycisphaerae bacterium]|nr:NAD(P)-dependent alcohol dehydrogenase [Saprospiraceae bacterium]
MKAALCTKYGSPEMLKIQEVARPIPKKNQVLVKNYATAVTSSDCYIRGFNVSTILKPLMGIVLGFRRPRQGILGMVFSGEIVETGKNVTEFKVGDQVLGFDRFGFGAYAEYKCISATGLLANKPNKMSYLEAAAIPYGGLLAQFYLKKVIGKRGKKILICGASGAVGSAAVQLAKYYEMQVTGVCSKANHEMVKSIGADSVIDYSNDEYLHGNTIYDVIFDAVPAGARKGKGHETQCKKVLSEGGRYISVRQGSPQFAQKDLILLNEIFEKGMLKPVIDRSYPLAQISEAHAYVESWHKKGNVLIEIQT